jgi:hypothetical protein
MPEQQKVDDIVESTSIIDKKNITKVAKSSTALEKEQEQEDIETIEMDEQEDIETIEMDEQEDIETIEMDDKK